MKSVHTTIQIDARLETVWSVLSDFSAWPLWNPIIPSIEGDVRVGADVSFRIHIEGMPAVPIRVRINRCERESVLSWIGGRSPVITGEHWFRMSSPSEGVTRFEHGEDFDGVASRLMGRWVLERFRLSYERLNVALKRRAESLRDEAARSG